MIHLTNGRTSDERAGITRRCFPHNNSTHYYHCSKLAQQLRRESVVNNRAIRKFAAHLPHVTFIRIMCCQPDGIYWRIKVTVAAVEWHLALSVIQLSNAYLCCAVSMRRIMKLNTWAKWMYEVLLLLQLRGVLWLGIVLGPVLASTDTPRIVWYLIPVIQYPSFTNKESHTDLRPIPLSPACLLAEEKPWAVFNSSHPPYSSWSW